MKFSKLAYLKGLHGVKMSASTFRVLVTVLNYTDANGDNAYPGLQRLAEDCCTSVSTVQRALKQLKADGWIRVEQRGGRRGDGTHWATNYSLSTGHELLDDPWASTGQIDASTGQMDDVNRSNGWDQPVTYDHPSDHEYIRS